MHGQPPPQPQATQAGTIEGHPAISQAPRHTMTSQGRQGDAVNVAFIGSEEELHRMFAAAGWYAADPLTLQTSVRIAADVVLRKPYEHAPVSDLYLWGRRHDVAFEQPVGASPKQRHHVRFWRSADVDRNGEPLWLGDAARAGTLDGYYWVDAFHRAREGKNGGGDPSFTDGRLAIGVIELRR